MVKAAQVGDVVTCSRDGPIRTNEPIRSGLTLKIGCCRIEMERVIVETSLPAVPHVCVRSDIEPD